MADYRLFKNLRGNTQGEGTDDYRNDLPKFPSADEDSPEVIAAAEKLNKRMPDLNSKENLAWDAESRKSPKFADGGEGTDTIANSGLPPGFRPVSDKSALPPGFRPVKEEKSGLPPGFRPVLPEGFKPVQEAAPTTPTLGDKKENTLWGDLNDRAEGTGRQIIDMGTFIPRAVASWGKGINELLQGGSRQEAGDVAHKFMEDTSVQGEYPTNEAINIPMREVGRGIQNLTTGSVMRDNPLAKKIFEDTASASLGYRGAKEVGNSVIEGVSRRIPEETPQLPNPNAAKAEVNPVSALAEQKGVAQRSQETQLNRYNENPQAFGVDESGIRNPYNKFGNAIPPNEVTLDDGSPVTMQQVEAAHQDHYGFPMPKPTGPYVMELMDRSAPNARTTLHFVQTVGKWTQDPFEKKLAGALLEQPDILAKIPVITTNVGENPFPGRLGRTLFDHDGVDSIELYARSMGKDHPIPDNYAGFSPEVILHEALHGRVVLGLSMGNYLNSIQNKDKPRYEQLKWQYQDEIELAAAIDQIAQKFKPALKDQLGESGLTHWVNLLTGRGSAHGNMYGDDKGSYSNRHHEFVSWGLTDAPIRAIMARLYDAPVGQGLLNERQYSHHANNVMDITKVSNPLVKKIQALKQPPQSMWDQIVDAMGKYVGLGREDRLQKAKSELRSFLDYVGDQKSALGQLEDIILPYLKEQGKDYNPMHVADALRHFKDPGYMEGIEMATRDMAAYDSLPPKAKQMAQKLVSPWTDYHQMYKDIGDPLYQYKDLNRVTGNVYPVTMVKNIANNPIVTFAVTKVRTIAGDSHHFEKMFVESLDDFEKAPKDQQNRIVTALNQMNRPEEQDLLKQSRAMNPQAYMPDPLKATDQELTHYGAHPQDIPLYRKTLEPLFKAILQLDKWSMKHGFGRDFDSDVIGYFPRSFGYGKFSVKGMNQAGGLEYFRRVPTWIQARAIEEMLKSKGLYTQRETNKDFADFKEHILALQEIDPKSTISKIGAATIAAAEEHRRTQEFERSARGVAGFIGQNINDPKELTLLRQQAYHRIQQSIEAYKAARLLEELLRPVQQDIHANYWYPNAVKWVADIVRRELGAEMSKIAWFDNGIQMALDWVHVRYLERMQKNLVADRRPGESTINPITHKELARYLSASASAYTLMGNIPNLVTNAFSVPLVSLLGGLPDAMMLNKDPLTATYVATRAHEQSLADWLAVRLGRWKLMKTDPALMKFMDLALERGLTVANAFNDIPQMRAEIEKTPLRRGWDTALNIPRQIFNDPIEIATNIMALLYYRRLFLLMYPQLNFQENFDLAVDLAKRYTGDYAKYNKALIWDKMGDIGQLGSNFNIWTGTRVAQTHEMTKNTITMKQVMPMVTLLTAGIVVAGIQGMPFVPDYENIRQFVNSHTKETNLPPIDVLLKDVGVPYWIRNGVILNSFGLDMTSRGKWSGWTDYGGVTFTMPFKAYDIMEYTYRTVDGSFPSVEKAFLGNRYKPSGPSVEEDNDFVKSLPSALQGITRQELMSRNLGKNRTMLTGHGSVGYVQKDNDYWWNIMNFKTNEQAEESRNFYNSLYSQHKHDNTIRTLKSHVMQEIMKYISAGRDGSPGRAALFIAQARANLIKLKKASPTDFDSFSADILREFEKETDTTETRLIKQAGHSHDAEDIKRLIEEVKTMRATRP